MMPDRTLLLPGKTALVESAWHSLRKVLPESLGGESHDGAVKVAAACLCHSVAFGLMAMDPFFSESGMFRWRQSSTLMLLSILIVLTIAFDWHLLGRPRGVNLFGQLLFFLPFTLFLARLLGSPWSLAQGTDLLSQVTGVLGRIAGAIGIGNLIPKFISDFFLSPSLFLLLVMFAFSAEMFRSQQNRVAACVSMLLVPFAVLYSSGSNYPSLAFVAGTLLMAIGIAFQYQDVDRIYREMPLMARISHLTNPLELRASSRLLQRAMADGRLVEKTAHDIVRRCCESQGVDLDEDALDRTAATLIRRLVFEHGVLQLQQTADGTYLIPVEAAGEDESTWRAIATAPRRLIVGTIAVVWWLMPIDLIPDALPIVGTMDDVLLLSAAAIPLAQFISPAVPRLQGKLKNSPRRLAG